MRELFVRSEDAHHRYVGENKVQYNMANTQGRHELSYTLSILSEVIYKVIPEHSWRLRIEWNFLSRAFHQTQNMQKETFDYRLDSLQTLLNELPDLLSSIHRNYSSILYPDSKTERTLRRELKQFHKRFDLQIRPLSTGEFRKLRETESKKRIDLTFDFALLDEAIEASVRRILSVVGLCDPLPQTKTIEVSPRQKHGTEEWIRLFSQDILESHLEVQEMLKQVQSRLTNAEDEYFVEQVTNEYYPIIFEAIQDCEDSKIPVNVKKQVIAESLKQFKFIQLGLQNILDSIVETRVSKFKQQTDFLRATVSKENSLSFANNK